MIVTCLGATLIAQFMGGKPLYSAILARTLAKQEQARATVIAQEPAVENTPQIGK